MTLDDVLADSWAVDKIDCLGYYRWIGAISVMALHSIDASARNTVADDPS